MTCPCLSNQKKMYISIQTAIIALIVFNPLLFKMMGSVLGDWVSSQAGLPTMAGLLLHGVVFAVILYFLMKPTKAAEDVKSQRQSVPGLPLL